MDLPAVTMQTGSPPFGDTERLTHDRAQLECTHIGLAVADSVSLAAMKAALSSCYSGLEWTARGLFSGLDDGKTGGCTHVQPGILSR